MKTNVRKVSILKIVLVCLPSSHWSSFIFALPNMLFLYSPNTSFLCFSSFFVLFNSGSNKPFFYAHFFSRPCSLLISISCKLFFFLKTSNYFFIFISNLFSSSSSLISSYFLCFSCFARRFSLCCSACYIIRRSTLSFYLISSSLSSLLKSKAS